MTIHLNYSPNSVSDVVLMPGDPLRAKWAANTFLKNVEQINDTRGMLGFTGTWNGNRVTIQGSGMGMPSLSIYVNELIKAFKVKTFIRIGSAGAMQENVALRDIILAMTASSTSTPSKTIFKEINYSPCANPELLFSAEKVLNKRKLRHHIGGIYSTDTFYDERPDLNQELTRHGVLAVEMETAELYTLAARHDCRALSILTISDHLLTGDSLSSGEREKGFGEMIDISLSSVFNAP